MSGQTGDQQDRTEDPTTRRLQKAQEEGEVPVSREAVLLAGLAATTLTFLMMGAWYGLNLMRPLAAILSQPGLPLNEPMALYHDIALSGLISIAPFAVPIVVAAAAATLMQTRFAMRSRALKVDFTRLSPLKELNRMFGTDSLIETIKSLAKLLIVGGAMAQVLHQELPRLTVLASAPLRI